MAMVYYVKAGRRPHTANLGRSISLQDLESRLQGQMIQYQGEEPPEFDPDLPSAYPQYVVIEVEAHELTGHLFSKTGFYLLSQRSPEEAEALIFPRS